MFGFSSLNITVAFLLVFIIIYFGTILLSSKYYSKQTHGSYYNQITSRNSAKQIMAMAHSNNTCPEINQGFEQLYNNEHKLSSNLNVNLKGYISI